MNNIGDRLIECLFKTEAIRVSPANSPFWYTSGKIGPYYINTHFLYGSESKANDLLKVIDSVKEDKQNCSAVISDLVLKNYREDMIYRTSIDTLLEAVSNTVPENSYEYVSGGERRDWFFSLAVSSVLKKPHITIYKDMNAFVYQNGKSEKMNTLDGAGILHVADLITSASSYERAWIPVIRKASGNMLYSWVIIDRMEGGRELLERSGVESHSLVNIDINTFKAAYERNYINMEQYRMVEKYIENPDTFMKDFFLNNPDFIRNALESGEKTAQRARLCIESGFCPTNYT